MLLVVLYFGLLGLLIGSAINALVWRLYVGRKWTKGRSECPECHHVLAAKDLVPVVSWVLLGGKCRYCKAPIHIQYPVVEAVTSGLFALSLAQLMPVTVQQWLMFGLWLAVLTALIILAVYDLRWMLLPDKVMGPAIGLATVLLLLRVWETHSWVAARGPVLAALVTAGAFFGLVVVTRGRAMGGGDIKLMFLMGLLLGLRGMAVALLLAFNVAAAVGVALIVSKRKRRRDHIPFGPFLAGATVVAYLYGGQIVDWYLRLNGLG
ncbi:MAG TPA: prepilin peptidase [Candidatus Saccharimonas sp.]|nr:prepilin peptidase [Candidatus Saccharimonas sp.]